MEKRTNVFLGGKGTGNEIAKMTGVRLFHIKSFLGDNVYITWWSNKTGNHEVLFRASNDNGASFSDKINLSNNTTTESIDAMIEASGNNVFVTWWERNETANDPVMRISNDNGLTFGPILSLANNGTIEG
jgi:hypothetical protein